MSLSVEIKRLDNLKELPLPSYATVGSAGMDLMAAIDENITVKPLERMLIPTGISIALPIGFEAQIRPRSGMAFKNGITVINSPGTIDSDYRGEICIPIVNLSQSDFVIERGMRIAQMVVAPHSTVNWNIVSDLNTTKRAEGGFGSTGIASNSKAA